MLKKKSWLHNPLLLNQIKLETTTFSTKENLTQVNWQAELSIMISESWVGILCQWLQDPIKINFIKQQEPHLLLKRVCTYIPWGARSGRRWREWKRPWWRCLRRWNAAATQPWRRVPRRPRRWWPSRPTTRWTSDSGSRRLGRFAAAPHPWFGSPTFHSICHNFSLLDDWNIPQNPRHCKFKDSLRVQLQSELQEGSWWGSSSLTCWVPWEWWRMPPSELWRHHLVATLQSWAWIATPELAGSLLATACTLDSPCQPIHGHKFPNPG